MPLALGDTLSACLQVRPMEDPLLVVRWENTTNPRNTPTTITRTTSTKKELQAEQLSVAYVVKNPDGSFSTVNIRKTSVQAAWTTIISETRNHQNQIVDMRMAPRDMWGKENVRRRDVFDKAMPVNQKDNLCDIIRQSSFNDPLLLVCWDRPQASAHRHDPKKCCKRKQWQYYIFTNATDAACSGTGGPIVLVHSAEGIGQLDEGGIISIGSTKFLAWITEKTRTDGWEVISMTDEAASVRFKL
jgi:hypothetical protein